LSALKPDFRKGKVLRTRGRNAEAFLKI